MTGVSLIKVFNQQSSSFYVLSLSKRVSLRIFTNVSLIDLQCWFHDEQCATENAQLSPSSYREINTGN